MAVNIEVRVDPKQRRQAEEAIERARIILGGQVTDAFREMGRSMLDTGVALSPEYLGDPGWNPPCDCTQCRRRRNQEGWQDATDNQTKEEDADSRARSLILSCLSPIQRKEFEARESFTVIAKSGRRYRIEKGWNFNIAVLSEKGNRFMCRLCAGPDEDVPVYDSMLSQKLWLENDEEGFLRVANRDGFMDDVPVYFGNRTALWRS